MIVKVLYQIGVTEDVACERYGLDHGVLVFFAERDSAMPYRVIKDYMDASVVPELPEIQVGADRGSL
ncbi:MAG TPA: hypothetical protein VJL31_13025 [Gemmatimonadales bacterium]|nr:hypothetical protein [Gemmatimonadales bacterium]